MGPLSSIKNVTKKYAVFKGRATRSEFGWFVIFYLIYTLIFAIILPLISIDYLDKMGYKTGNWPFLIMAIIFLSAAIPYIAVSVRRLHDMNASAFCLLLYPIGLGPILIIILIIWRGTVGDNDYGQDPSILPHNLDILEIFS